MQKAESYQTVAAYHDALAQQRRDMQTVVESPEYQFLQPALEKMHAALKEQYQFDSLTVITGEQPYGALGTPKVLGKRILAEAIQEAYGDVTTIELFANHDLVGSEPGFYRLVIPTQGTADGILKHNILANNMRKSGLTASGITLPNASIQKQVGEAVKNFRYHYPGSKAGEGKYDIDTMYAWAKTYGLDREMHYDAALTPANYSEAHIAWLLGVEQQIGLTLDHITREGDVDLLLARNGGMDVMGHLWKQGLRTLAERGYEAVSLKLQEGAAQNTPFNLAKDGVRLESRYAEHDDSQIETYHPRSKTYERITIDQALSGQYDFSWKAVPRVMLYSLASIDGHITGGGSVYNTDARNLLDVFGLPYFPIVTMAPTIDGTPVSVVQYESVALARATNASAKQAVREGTISILDFALSCRMAEANQAIQTAIAQGEAFRTDQPVVIPNKLGQIPQQ